MSSEIFAHVTNWDVTAQGQGAQRWASQTSFSFLLLMLNAGVTLLCSPSLTQLLPGHRTIGRGRHRTTSCYHCSICTRGAVTVSVQSKLIKQDSHFYSLKRCSAAFSGLGHIQMNFQVLKVHWVLLECIQATEVTSWTPLPYGLFKKFRN